jgi:hypothetical protein
MIPLEQLEAKFLIVKTTHHYHETDDFTQAQGIKFLCPLCYRRNNGPEGTHTIQVFFAERNVPASLVPRSGGWKATGSGYHDLTITPSIAVRCSDCEWHGFVTNGKAG